MKRKTSSVMVSYLDGHVLVLKHCNDILFRHICTQSGAHPCCTCFQPETMYAFCTVNQSAKIRQGPSRARLCRKSFDVGHVPQPRITRVFQDPRHASTMKQVCNGSTCGNDLGKSTRCAVVEMKSLPRHIFQRRRPVEVW